MTKYTNARDVLPEKLIKEIQKYVKGQHIYIPQNERKKWGSKTGTRAEMFHLSEERIRGIVYEGQANKLFEKKFNRLPE